MPENEQVDAETKKPRAPLRVFRTHAGEPVSYTGVKKFFKDIITYHNGSRMEGKRELVELADPNLPLGDRPLIPGRHSPVCAACGLDQMGAKRPYLEYAGPDRPVVTILVECVSKRDDDRGQIGVGNPIAYLSSLIYRLESVHKVSLGEIRWVPITRCAYREGKPPNYKTKGNWCRYHAIQDLILHPPKVVIPVGTDVLGLLSHKSNAQDWSGRLLTWRGWPDDWLTEPDYILDRTDPAHKEGTVRGHPIFGPAPQVRIPMVPLQSQRIVLAAQNEVVTRRWVDHLIYALKVGKMEIPPPDYIRPWYHLSLDPQEIIQILQTVIQYANAHPPFRVAYDTETTGLKAWAYYKRVSADEVTRSADPRIVFMMFRWVNPETQQPESLGFPWDYPESELKPFLQAITPYVVELLATASIVGHNLTFDELFTIATVGTEPAEHEPFTPDGALNPSWLWLQDRINLLASAMGWDTWHMAFTVQKRRGSLGLEVITYGYAPDLAGYEEDMTLLIDLHGDLMNPANNKGGHYANCPKPLWETHLKPYVMGDVEATYRARDALAVELSQTQGYRIPMAKPGVPGRFRYYTCPNREWVYQNIMVPASRTLTKIMARGMHIDAEELITQEQVYPERVEAAKRELRDVDPAISAWCQTKLSESQQVKEGQSSEDRVLWELDLENKSQLKELLFQVLKCPIQRMTKSGRKIYGDELAGWEHLECAIKLEYAAVDKYTLNRLAVDHPNLRPLQQYRKEFKLYSTYVRPLRNMMAERLDKKQRVKEPHLSVDHCIHAQFMLTGTRGGRLSCRDPNLQQLPNDGKVKRLFSSRFGSRGCIYAADLSQIELRLMAAACGDASMVGAYLNDVDLHSLTASKIAWSDGKISYEEFTKKHMEKLQHEGHADQAKDLELKRKIAKTVNFLTGYGGGAFGLQNVLANNQVYITLEECEHIIDSFFEAYPALQRFLGVYKDFILTNACAVSLFGRVRFFEEVRGEDQEATSKALRAGCNHLIQSTASDMMLLCLITIEALMRDAGLNSLLVSTVHDSLVVDALREELPQIHDIAYGVMNDIPTVIQSMLPGYDTSWMIVPLAGDSEVGLNYLETNKISGSNPDWEALLQPWKKG
jgi:DNA polymerase I-like protein with 3'-5' exonuclease and polymerase domains